MGSMNDKPKTRAEEIAYDVGVKDGQHGQDKCPYITEPFAQYWRDGHAQGKAERGSGGCNHRVEPDAAAAKPERPVWKDCAARCRYWDSEKRWCQKYVRTEPKSCEQCKEF